jgi:16S rRNA (cytidine1402-2'-O)-methyltransferase
MAGTLYIVATPIGNLEDMNPRALKTLAVVDSVLAEDTRVTKKLMAHFAIRAPVERFDANADAKTIAGVVRRLAEGDSLALVTDAGTPAISDPGSWLVAQVLRELGDAAKIVPIPGPSALTAALSVSGFPSDRFAFFGFLPPKKGRATRLAEIAACADTAVLYESPHRIGKTLAELAALSPERNAVVCRELTKMFETIYRGKLAELARPGAVRAQGEFAVVLGPQK